MDGTWRRLGASTGSTLGRKTCCPTRAGMRLAPRPCEIVRPGAPRTPRCCSREEGAVRNGQAQGPADRLPTFARLPLDQTIWVDLLPNDPQPPLVAGDELVEVVDVGEDIVEEDPDLRDQRVFRALRQHLTPRADCSTPGVVELRAGEA